MTRRLGAAGAVGAASMALAVLLTMAAVLLGASAARAQPTTVPLAFDFTGLLPGDSRTESYPYDLEQDARIVSVTFDTTPGATWSAELCWHETCDDVLTMIPGDELAAGRYELRVGVTMTSLQPGATSSVSGQLSFVEAAAGGLAHTGSAPWPVSLAALALTAVGLLLVLASRRRRRHDERPATPAAAG